MSFTASKQLQVVGVKASGDGTPTPEQMALINGYTLKELRPEDVYVRSVYLAHNAIDRDQECFDDALLEDFSATLPGKGFFVKHPLGWDGSSGPGEGIWFEAKILTMSLDEARKLLKQPDLMFAPDTKQAKILEASRYMLRLDYDVETRKLIDKTDAGIAGRHSIGFSAKGRVEVTDEYGNTIAHRIVGPGEAREGSVVWLESQYGAHAFKHAGGPQPSFESHEEEPSMAMSADEQKEFNDAKTARQTAENEVKTLKPKAEAHDEIMAVAGEKATVDSVKALIAAGLDYRKGLEADLLRLERLQGVVGDTEEDAKSAGQVYASLSNEAIKTRVEKLQAKFPGDGASQLAGGDPNATGAEGDGKGKKGLRDASVTAKAMGHGESKAA
jgi:hypothetical protein